MAYNATTLKQVAVFCTTPNGQRGAIWGGGGGVSADTNSPPNLFVVTANGTYDVNPGPGIDYSDSVLRMQVVSGKFQVMDYFTPANQNTLAVDDLDLGSSPALLLPDQPGAHAHLLATGGKDGRIWLLNRDNLGGYQTNDAGAVQVIPQMGSDILFGGGSYWNGNLYFQETGDTLNQFALDNGMMPASPTSSSASGFGYPSSPAAVSSNGTSNGVLWFLESDSYSQGPAILHAYDPTDVSNEIYNSTQAPNNRDRAGIAVKFAVPTVANGKVYVGTSTEVDVYGLLAP
jgi:hypothetical protein